MKDQPTVTAWHNHHDPVDEITFTPWAVEGWHAWNGQSPEWEVCEFVKVFIEMQRPKLVVETGVGQGYMTRAIADILTSLDEGQQLNAYESNDQWRETMQSLPFWTDNQKNAWLSSSPTPSDVDLELADLCVFDSEWEIRFSEIERWDALAHSGAVALIHDTGSQPKTIHASLRELIVDLHMTGVFLNNPRGCFMAVQP